MHLRALGASGLILSGDAAEAMHLTCSFSTRTNSRYGSFESRCYLLWLV